jgi:hypothetical protein
VRTSKPGKRQQQLVDRLAATSAALKESGALQQLLWSVSQLAAEAPPNTEAEAESYDQAEVIRFAPLHHLPRLIPES